MLRSCRPARAAGLVFLATIAVAGTVKSAAAQVIARGAPRSSDLPLVAPNDNRTPAGVLRDGVLTVRMVATTAHWAPEGDDGPVVVVAALAEEGGAPSIPAPLIRVPAGTVVEATIRNALPDSTLYVRGLEARPVDSLSVSGIPPGASHTFRFVAADAGTWLYAATPGHIDLDVREREQMAGAIVVDAPGERTDDRVFVMNIWGEPRDSVSYANALAINGRSWPHTEPLAATVGDTLRWRVLNGTARSHPMHLHGFYFLVESRGTLERDSVFAPDRRRLAVTEDLSTGHTMRMSWIAERPGNWLFHCHLSFHVVDEARLAHDEHRVHSSDPREHMAGLVLGIAVRARPDWIEPARADARPLRLLVQEGTPRMHAPRAFGYVLQRDATAPAPDSIEIPGSALYLTRGEPVDITVVNHLAEATAIHWHGIELESYSDGVAGWSGAPDRLAPAIAPGDSFVARLTLPRAGTFIYHTHLNDIEQVTSGLYGGIVVLEPGAPHDPAHDHLYVAGWDGADRIVVNGDSTAARLDWSAGDTHRLRFVNIGPAQRLFYEVRRDSALVAWRPLAKDGADLPPSDALVPASRRLAVGETFDAVVRLEEPAEYELIVRRPGGRVLYRQPIRVAGAVTVGVASP